MSLAQHSIWPPGQPRHICGHARIPGAQARAGLWPQLPGPHAFFRSRLGLRSAGRCLLRCLRGESHFSAPTLLWRNTAPSDQVRKAHPTSHPRVLFLARACWDLRFHGDGVIEIETEDQVLNRPVFCAPCRRERPELRTALRYARLALPDNSEQAEDVGPQCFKPTRAQMDVTAALRPPRAEGRCRLVVHPRISSLDSWMPQDSPWSKLPPGRWKESACCTEDASGCRWPRKCLRFVTKDSSTGHPMMRGQHTDPRLGCLPNTQGRCSADSDRHTHRVTWHPSRPRAKNGAQLFPHNPLPRHTWAVLYLETGPP